MIKSLQIYNSDLWSSQVNFQMLCISCSTVWWGMEITAMGSQKMESQPDNLDVSLKYLYPPQFSYKYSALQDPLCAVPSSGCGERGLALPAPPAAFPHSLHNTWDRKKWKIAFLH